MILHGQLIHYLLLKTFVLQTAIVGNSECGVCAKNEKKREKCFYYRFTSCLSKAAYCLYKAALCLSKAF
jgi:hypothetical protein